MVSKEKASPGVPSSPVSYTITGVSITAKTPDERERERESALTTNRLYVTNKLGAISERPRTVLFSQIIFTEPLAENTPLWRTVNPASSLSLSAEVEVSLGLSRAAHTLSAFFPFAHPM